MKKIVYLISALAIFLFCGQSSNAQTKVKLDTIYKVEGKVMAVDVVKVTTKYVSFKVPDNTELFTIQRKEIHKIKYKNGRIEEYNKPVVMMVDEYSWEAVWLTEDKADVADMYERGTIKADSPASSRSPKAAKKSAIIRLKKKAANKKGTTVLVTEKKATGGYGDFPGYYIEGVVYGYEPLDEEAEEGQDTAGKDIL